MLKKEYYIITILFIYLVFNSCNGIGDPGGEPVYDGLTFRISNRTNEIYQGEIVIGSLVNNKFIATDSIKFIRSLEVGSALSNYPHFVGENRWKPNLAKIRKIPSERCYFKLKLSNGRSGIITRYNSNEFFCLLLPATKHYRGEFGRIFLNIDYNQLSGRAAEEF